MLLLAPLSSWAQTNTGEISGVVSDDSGGVLPGATVTATHEASGRMIVRVSDAEGRFFLPALPVGTWAIRTELLGFAPQTQTGIVVEVGRALTVEVQLSLGGLTEEVVIRGQGVGAHQCGNQVWFQRYSWQPFRVRATRQVGLP